MITTQITLRRLKAPVIHLAGNGRLHATRCGAETGAERYAIIDGFHRHELASGKATLKNG